LSLLLPGHQPKVCPTHWETNLIETRLGFEFIAIGQHQPTGVQQWRKFKF
jgi:hypothetical protein